MSEAPRNADLYAGPGGWSEGARQAGVEMHGVEKDESACATARKAGHGRTQIDVRNIPTGAIDRLDYLHSSSPCEGFSFAGPGKGRLDGERLLHAVDTISERPERSHVAVTMARFHNAANHPLSVLALEPMRWIVAGRPRWVTFEQVPTVLPLWEAYGVALRRWGYSVWVGKMHAEQYGVPQARTRAILIARRDGVEAAPPAPTHSRYHRQAPGRLDEGVLPWVSMAQALPDRLPADHWGHRRPATTIVSSFRPDIVRGPGYRKAGDGPCQNAPGATPVSVSEAGVLQGFRADYPWQGTEAKQRQQIGNAVPPPLAAAVVRSLVGSR